MRSRHFRFFWTELGRRLTGDAGELPAHLPAEMKSVLTGELPAVQRGELVLDERLSRVRHIYSYTWKILRDEGFSRPLRLEPWPGISLLLPFYRGTTAFLPQSFSSRIPREERTLSLAGRTAAAALKGVRLWIVAATWDSGIEDALRRGGVSACSLGNLRDLCRRSRS